MLVAKVTKTKMAERLCQMQAPFLRDCDIELQLQVADERNQLATGVMRGSRVHSKRRVLQLSDERVLP